MSKVDSDFELLNFSPNLTLSLGSCLCVEEPADYDAVHDVLHDAVHEAVQD